MRKNYGEMLLIAVFTAVIGQIYIYPFGTDFRLTLGVVVFTFLILYFKVPILETAALSTVFVLAVRTGLDVAGGNYQMMASVERHMPAIVFYLIYGIVIDQIGIRDYIQKPAYFIIIVSFADITANFFELLVRNSFRSHPLESLIGTIVLAALIRAVIVLALFWVIRYYNLLIVKEVHQKRYQELLLLTARLNSEVLFLRKSMQDIEAVMVRSYSIYTHSKALAAGDQGALPVITGNSLSLAIDIHEIKKDYLRIVHSIGKIIPEEEMDPKMSVGEILRTIQDIYEGYGEATGHVALIKTYVRGELSIARYYELISILNNLVHNSLEATRQQPEPWIRIDSELRGEWLVIAVADNGRGIDAEDTSLIFEPGFTTKLDSETGELPTGLGLTHVRMLTEMLGGTVQVQSAKASGTVFTLTLPVHKLTTLEEAL